MSDLTPAAASLLAAHHGVISHRDLRAAGVGRRTQERLAHAEVLRSVGDGIFVISTAPRSLEQRCVVLSQAHPGGFVSGPTAGMLLQLRRMPRSAQLHFTVPHGRHLRQAPLGVRFHQSRGVEPRDFLLRPDGIAISAPARLAFDLAGYLGETDHVSAVNDLLHRQLVTVAELGGFAERLASGRRPGTRRFLTTLGRLGLQPAESHPEVVVGELLRRAQIPAVAQQRIFDLPDGQVIRLDFAVPEIRWGIEIDVHPVHLDLAGTTRDKRRDRQIHQLGWQIDRITELDLRDQRTLGRELALLYQRRRAAVTGAGRPHSA